MKYKSNIKDAIQEYLIQSELSAHQFSQALGISESNIYNWLHENYLPSLSSFVIIADYLNCSMAYLLGLSDDKWFQKAELPSDFITQIQLLMAEKKCNKRDVARACGIGNSGVSKWFTQRKLPKIEMLIKLSEYFGCSIDYLIGRSVSR